MERKPDKGFKYWFTNVFWFHYGKLGIIIVLALVVVVFLTVQAFKKERYDLNVVLALKGPVSYEATGELNGLIAEAAGDVDGNGEVNINIQTVDLSDEAHFEDNHYRLLLYLSLPEYTVFIMDGQYSQTYCSKEGYFNELADYGIETDDPTGKRIYAGGRRILREMGDYDYYVCLSDWTTDGKGDAEWTAAAVRAIKAILASE